MCTPVIVVFAFSVVFIALEAASAVYVTSEHHESSLKLSHQPVTMALVLARGQRDRRVDLVINCTLEVCACYALAHEGTWPGSGLFVLQ